MLDADVVNWFQERHRMNVTTDQVARCAHEVLQRYQEPKDIIATLGTDELAEEDRRWCTAPARCSSSSARFVAEQFTGQP